MELIHVLNHPQQRPSASHQLVQSFNFVSSYASRNFCVAGVVVLGTESMCCSFSEKIRFKVSQSRSSSVYAGWVFGESDKRSDLDASCEHSETANEDILMFFLELDLATRVQYALNLEQYDIARQLRNKLNEVESDVIKFRDIRRGTTPKSEAQDMAIEILRLRADLQTAAEKEDYKLAAELRDEISKLEAKSLSASVKAQALANAKYTFRLGQKVKHKIFGYEGVICGMDPICCETKSWMEGANIEKLVRGPDQPFYQVLVDVQVDPTNLLVSYVAEENLLVSIENNSRGRFDHPYTSFLFYGVDAGGDYIPIKQLREKYNQPRHELPNEDQKAGQ